MHSMINHSSLSQGRKNQWKEYKVITSERFAFDSCGSPLLIAWTWILFAYFESLFNINHMRTIIMTLKT